MFYKERHPRLIKACQVESEEAKFLGVIDTPSYLQGYCSACGKPAQEHKYLNGQPLCLGSYIIYDGSNMMNLMSKENFEELYKPICEEEL